VKFNTVSKKTIYHLEYLKAKSHFKIGVQAEIYHCYQIHPGYSQICKFWSQIYQNKDGL